MSFLAPGWIGLAALASLAIAAIHLIAWRLPRAMVLPTARFVPDEPARRAARTVRPSDLALLALRVTILMVAGLALARPVIESKPTGTATVVAVEAPVTEEGANALRDSLRTIPGSDAVSVLVFDTVARIAPASVLSAPDVGESRETSLTAGLLAALREAHSLAGTYDTVRIVVAARFELGSLDQATSAVRATWPDSIRLVRIPGVQQPTIQGRVETRPTGDDAVVAGVRLALANGIVRGESRLIRDVASAEDTAWADSGRALVVWPRADAGAAERVDAIYAGGHTAIGHFIAGSHGDSGRVIARWANGDPAGRESSNRLGCIRTIGFDVSDAGDFVLTPSFQRLLSALLGPCGGSRSLDIAPDSILAALAAPPAVAPAINSSDDFRMPNRLAAGIMALAVLLALIELAVRRVRTTAVGPSEQSA